jgi:putative transposase
MSDMGASYTDLFVHLVWATADREPLISKEIEDIVYRTIAARCRGLGCVPMAIGGVADHVHLLVGLSPTVTVAELAKDVKGASAHAVGQHVRSGPAFRWQRGYGAFSLRREDTAIVRQYILGQEQHHARGATLPGWEPPAPEQDTVNHVPEGTRSDPRCMEARR